MAPRTEDSIPAEYKYSWTKDSELPLDEYLNKFRPSMVQNDGTKPWIWVERSPHPREEGREQAIVEGTKILEELTEKVESIKNDGSIPVRSSKKTGAKSKKEVREAAQAASTKLLEEVSVKHGYVSGKWLVFAPADKVDIIWSSIATSLVSGPLAATAAHSAKVATSPQDESPNYQHIICVYVPDVYDKPKVLEVMKVLLGNHGLNLSGVKSNLYTELGIDSKHPSGIQSTVWKNSALLTDAESKALKEAYFSGLAAKKAEQGEKGDSAKKADQAHAAPIASSSDSKAKPKPRTKTIDDPYASTDDEGEPSSKPAVQEKAKPKKTKKKAQDDPFASSGGEDDEAPKPKVKKALARKRKESPSDDDSDDQGKAKRPKVRK